MLTRQWQLGEFEGDDAGSAVTSRNSARQPLIWINTKLTNHALQSFDKTVPFEAKVEQRLIPFSTLEQQLSLDIRLVMGRRWFQLLKNKGLLTNPLRQFFLNHYKIEKPDPTQKKDAGICAASDGLAAISGRGRSNDSTAENFISN